MHQPLLEPLKYYETHARDLHSKNASEHFDKLLAQSKINVEENRATVKKYNSERKVISKLNKQISRYKTLRVFLIIFVILGFIAVNFGIMNLFSNKTLGIVLLVLGVVAIVASFLFLFLKVNKTIKHFSEKLSSHEKKAGELFDEASAQMAPLNDLFDNVDAIKLIEKTIPEIDFDFNYTKKSEEALVKNCDYNDLVGEGSVLDTLSGRFCNNPFLFFRYKSFHMGTHLYTGFLTIRWTDRYRDSQGRYRSRVRTQTLTATLEKPKPYYTVKTALGYGCQAAPDLTFTRDPQHSEQLTAKELEKRITKGSKKLKKKARKATTEGGNFQEMANEEFDALFCADDRNHEVQFRLMYTPLAQQNTVDLLTKKVGYGDDFYFRKLGRFNIIESEHSQGWNMNTSAVNYVSHDVDTARRNFIEFNEDFFKSVYFDLAPLMAVPSYHEEPAYSMSSPDEYNSNYTHYEYEALANAIGASTFAHESTKTDTILRASLINKLNGEDVVKITASSFTTVEHVDFVPVLGGDGRMHAVPVPWLEYIPVFKESAISIKELNLSEREFKQKPEAISNVHARWAYLHGLLAYVRNL